MRYVQALLENTDVSNLLQENAGIVNQASQEMMNFYQVLNSYICENIVEFLDEDLEQTARNIYTFSTYATKQMLTEISTIYGAQIHQSEVLKEAAKNEFV